VRGNPEHVVGTRPGPKGRVSGYAVHRRVTPRHMTTAPSSLPFSSGVKVTTPAKPRPPPTTVQFSVVGAIRHTIAFPAVHVRSHHRLSINQSFFEQWSPCEPALQGHASSPSPARHVRAVSSVTGPGCLCQPSPASVAVGVGCSLSNGGKPMLKTLLATVAIVGLIAAALRALLAGRAAR
jgi:hypothetical protein